MMRYKKMGWITRQDWNFYSGLVNIRRTILVRESVRFLLMLMSRLKWSFVKIIIILLLSREIEIE